MVTSPYHSNSLLNDNSLVNDMSLVNDNSPSYSAKKSSGSAESVNSSHIFDMNINQNMTNSLGKSNMTNSYMLSPILNDQYSNNVSCHSTSPGKVHTQSNHSSCVSPSGQSPSMYTAVISPKEMAAHEACNFKDVKGVYKNCRGIWAAQWTDERGQRHTKYFNPKYYATEAEARREAFKFKVHIAREIELRGGVQKRRSNASLASVKNNIRDHDLILPNSYVRERSNRTYKAKKGKLNNLKMMINHEIDKSGFDLDYNYVNSYQYPYPPLTFNPSNNVDSTLFYQDIFLHPKQPDPNFNNIPNHLNPNAPMISQYIPPSVNSSNISCYDAFNNIQSSDAQGRNSNMYNPNYFHTPFDPTYVAALNRYATTNNNIVSQSSSAKRPNFNKTPITHYTALPHGTTLCACGCGSLALSPSRYAIDHPLKPPMNQALSNSNTINSMSYNHSANVRYSEENKSTGKTLDTSSTSTLQTLSESSTERRDNTITGISEDTLQFINTKNKSSLSYSSNESIDNFNLLNLNSYFTNSLVNKCASENNGRSVDLGNPFAVIAFQHSNNQSNDIMDTSVIKKIISDSPNLQVTPDDISLQNDNTINTLDTLKSSNTFKNGNQYKKKNSFESQSSTCSSENGILSSSAYSVDSSPSFPFKMSWKNCFSFHTNYPLDFDMPKNECHENLI